MCRELPQQHSQDVANLYSGPMFDLLVRKWGRNLPHTPPAAPVSGRGAYASEPVLSYHVGKFSRYVCRGYKEITIATGVLAKEQV